MHRKMCNMYYFPSFVIPQMKSEQKSFAKFAIAKVMSFSTDSKNNNISHFFPHMHFYYHMKLGIYTYITSIMYYDLFR